MKYNIDDEIRKLNEIKDSFPVKHESPDDKLINEYENLLRIKFNPEYRKFIKGVGYAMYNGLETISLEKHKAIRGELLRCVEEARSQGLPKDWLPICEDNGAYYCVRPDGKVAFWSPVTEADEVWDNIAAWVHDVWIGGN